MGLVNPLYTDKGEDRKEIERKRHDAGNASIYGQRAEAMRGWQGNAGRFCRAPHVPGGRGGGGLRREDNSGGTKQSIAGK